MYAAQNDHAFSYVLRRTNHSPAWRFDVWFRFADFLGWLITDPIGVENSRLVDALIGMRAEEIALRLQQIRRQTRRTIAVECTPGSAEGRRGHAVINGG